LTHLHNTEGVRDSEYFGQVYAGGHAPTTGALSDQ